MKKLLTILALAALLCMACSVALAVTDYPEGYVFDCFDDIKALVGSSDTVTVDNVKYNLIDAGHVNVVSDHSAGGKAVSVIGKNGSVTKIIELNVKTTHSIYKDTYSTYAPTCGKDGQEVWKCWNCDWTKTKVKDATGNHQTYKKYVDATCQHGAYYAYVCDVCGAEVSKEDIVGSGIVPHSYPLSATSMWCWNLTEYSCANNLKEKKPTGWAIPTCKWCGKEDETQKYTFASAADYRNWCEARGKHVDKSYDGHKWGNTTKVAATCYHGNGNEQWCNICGQYEFRNDDGSKLAPVWVVKDASKVVCKLTIGDKVDLICKTCGGKAPNHKIDEAQIIDYDGIEAKDAFGTKYVAGRIFTIRTTGSNTLTISGYHDLKKQATVKMLNTDTGKVADSGSTQTCVLAQTTNYECAICGYNNGNNIFFVTKSAPGHKWNDWYLYQAGTETNRYAHECSVCGHREIAIAKDIKDLPVKHDHNWVLDEKAVKCGEKQAEPFVCTICGEKKTEQVVEIPHDLVKKVIVAATCKAEGLELDTCKRCDYSEYVVIPKDANAHVWDDGKVTKEATKDGDGVKTFTCTVCGEKKTEAIKYVVTADAKYTLTAGYAGGVVAGKLTHVEDTKEADAKYVRVTFYIGTYYMATTAEVEADGTYAVEGVGPIDYITVVPTGNSAVNPDEVKRIGEAQEIFVK